MCLEAAVRLPHGRLTARCCWPSVRPSGGASAIALPGPLVQGSEVVPRPLARGRSRGKMHGMDRSPSPVRDVEAYVPCEPGPEVERYWLPETRAFAIEWARQARLVGNNKLAGNSGLAVDDATLERVADAIMDPAHPPPWQPLTAEERRDVFPRFLWDKVRGYLAEHEIAADVDVRWHDGKRTIVVGILGDPEPHRAPLRRIAGSRVIVWHRPPAPPHAAAELAAISERISADKPEL